MKKKDCEVSFDERKALETQVFPKLSCSGWFMRFIRLVIPSLVFAFACATGVQPADLVSLEPASNISSTAYLEELKNELHISDSTAEFESVMPESGFILGSTVAFTKKKHQDS